MDKLLSKKQTVLTNTFLTVISTTVGGVTSKNAANHASSDKIKTIDYNDMPTDLWEQCAFGNYSNKIVAMENTTDYHNDLTFDQHGAK